MINWLGQTINVGDIVGRGAKNHRGSASVFKVGKVVELKPEHGTVKVEWLATPSYVEDGDGEILNDEHGIPIERAASARERHMTASSPKLHSLFKLDPSTFNLRPDQT